VLLQHFQPAPRCLLNPFHFTAGKLSAELIDPAQCPETSHFPANAEAN
jgi:hypothetical protein